MILGVGIDICSISRFAHWHSLNKKSLERIFSTHEITYCLQSPILSAQRFATRFAAREAFLKALSAGFPAEHFSLLSLCRLVSVRHQENGSPALEINWHALIEKYPGISARSRLEIHISLSHDQSNAIALIVIAESN